MLELRFPNRSSTRQRLVRLADGVCVSYHIYGVGFLGDCILAVQHALTASNRLGRMVGLYPWGIGNGGLSRWGISTRLVVKLLELLPVDGKVEVIATEVPPEKVPFNWGKYLHVPTYNPWNEEPVEYALIRTPWKFGPYGRMCYQTRGRSAWRRQNFPGSEAVEIYNSFPTLERIEVGLPLSIDQSVEVMLKSDFFVGIDSGMAHLARCVGLPVFINPNRVPLDWFYRWHRQGSPSYTLFRTVPELRERVRERLPWALSAV